MSEKSGGLKRMAAKLSLPEELRETIRTVLYYTGVFLGGFLFSLGDIFSLLSPFGAAFALSVPFAYMPAAAGGAILGYVVSETSEHTVRYAAAVIIGAIILFTFHKVLNKKLKPVVYAAIGGVSIAATGMAVAIGSGEDAQMILLCAAEGLCGGGYCLIFQNCARILGDIKTRRILKSGEWVCLLLGAAAVLLCIGGIKIGFFSPARMLSLFALLVCACFGKETAGAMAGICFGCVMGFADGQYIFGGAYALGGLVAGLAAPLGRFMAVIGFLCGGAMVFLFSGEGDLLLPFAVEGGAAALAVLLLPKKSAEFFSSFFVRPGTTPESESMRELLRFQLHAASSTVYEVSGSVKAVSKALAGIRKKNEGTIYGDVRDEVCKGCSRMTSCWEHNFENTIDAFQRMTLCRKNGEIPDRDNLPPYFSSRCVCVEALTECFNRCYVQREYREAAENKISEARTVAADQFTAISVMLENLAEELQRDILFDPEIAKKAADAMENEGIRVRDCLCIINEGGWTVLQVFCAPMKKKISAAELAAAVSDFTGIDFAPPVVGPSDSGQILLLFCEKPPCAVRAAVSQITGDGQSVCGDAYDFFNDGRGHYMMILSDGMGTGSRAAVDGAMTTNLASKLIRAGFSFECVVKTVNSALMVKSKDESLSTLDIVSIDLFNSDATFYKAGAAASLLCRRGKTIRIERASLPLGILRDVEFERVTGKIGDGDLIIMMSDGAMVIPPDKLRQTLSDCADQPVQEIASAITALAKEESPTGKADDITVLAAVVHKRA